MATKHNASTITFPERIDEIQASASKQVKEAIDFLSAPPRAFAEEVGADLDKRRKAFSKRAEKIVKSLRSDFDKRTKDLGKRADAAVNDARKRTEAIAKRVRKQVEAVVEPVTTRLNVATRADVERLRKRLDQIERRVGELAEPAATK